MTLRATWRSGLFIAAGLLLTGTIVHADDHAPLPSQELTPTPVRPSSTFLSTVLMTPVDARLRGESAAALEFATFRANPMANPWTRDFGAVERVEAGAINATTKAMKRYVIDHLGLNGWSLPLGGGSRGGGGIASLRTDSGGTRLRFGFSHMAPRAEVLIPSGNTGRVSLGLDGRGRVSAAFETAAARLRVGGSYDPGSRDLNVVFVTRF